MIASFALALPIVCALGILFALLMAAGDWDDPT